MVTSYNLSTTKAIFESHHFYLGIWLWVFEDWHHSDWDAPRVESFVAMVDLATHVPTN